MTFHNDAPEIRDRLNAMLEQVLDRFWAGWQRKGPIAYPAVKSKTDLGSFQVFVARSGKHPRGKWFRNSAGIGGDELNLFAYGMTGAIKATDRVFAAAREFVGLARGGAETPAERQQREARAEAAERARLIADEERKESEAKKRRRAKAIWLGAKPIAGTTAERYLHGRGLPTPQGGWPASLRYQPSLVHPFTEQSLPALVARAEDANGNGKSIWRIFLGADGGKAKVQNAKLGLGAVDGCAVRFGGIANEIAVAEGVETALAVWAMLGYRTPVWAALSTSGMMNLVLPIDVERVRIFPDADHPFRLERGEYVPCEPPGRAAARKLAANLYEYGVDAVIEAEGEPGTDYLDLWNAMRAEQAA